LFFNHKNGTASCDGFKIVISDGVVYEPEEIDESKTLNLLFTLLQEGITIKNESDAKLFETALDYIYPIN
jgi:hypothetical protein